MDIALVGAGRVGTALAVLLRRAGHRISGASGRKASRERVRRFLPGVPFAPGGQAARGADAVILGVPDDAIAPVAGELAETGAFGERQAVIHLSGAAPLAGLDRAREAGALVLALHPLQTFPDVEAGIERLPGSAVAVTAWEEEAAVIGDGLARDAGARPFRIAEERKALYHAAAVFCSNYLVAVEGLAEEVFRAAGVMEPVEAFGPLVRATLDNVLRSGPAEALTGPVVRGDVGTVRRNLEALARHVPHAVPPYIALAAAALSMAERSGRVREAAGTAMREVLDRWR
jgi:predicted short-subunit dehydrogenase-like oxidoreductase (DUF2520 family)